MSAYSFGIFIASCLTVATTIIWIFMLVIFPKLK